MFATKSFYEHAELNLTTLQINFSQKNKQFSPNVRKLNYFTNCMKNIVHYKRVPMDTKIQFWQFCIKVFPTRAKNFPSASQNENKTWIFSAKLFSVEGFLWTGRGQLWQVCRKLLPEHRKSLAQWPNVIEKKTGFSEKSFSFKQFFSTIRKCSFQNPAENFLTEDQRFLP